MDNCYIAFQGKSIPPINNHPEMIDYKEGEELMVAKLDLHGYNLLNKRVQRQKINELLEEPSSYEDEDDYNPWTCRRR